ncbi:MAG: hypothetical protein JO171_17700 [Paludibacterium sp.]|uniref:hypothetical protein n=1 Tax=Paludibacterium sp. TaxID=1917523 RepID=UPI0026002A63|nr:hypothetical protein [Paludibacterium sp.]MBV8048988.1 hypothetical protein [Paludibacterium sp.]MBV8647495.1 hypothetical protein [Paludibacterium sp.]
MIFGNPLQPIYDAFVVANDCFKVAVRAAKGQETHLLGRTQFFGATSTEAETAVLDASNQASDLVILALFATFERWVIEHLQGASGLIAGGYPVDYSASLANKFEKAVERWRVEEVLDLFKVEVDQQLIMQAKQIKKYRDWIAHRNPQKALPPKATPEVTFDVLSDLIEQIRTTHAPSPLAASA